VKGPLRILIAEDSHFQREALRGLFASEPSIEVVGEARDGTEALLLIQQHRPDVVLLDISLGPGPDGLEVARKLQPMNLGVKVIFLSGQDYSEVLLREFVQQALAIDVAGFLVKSSSSTEILDGVKSVAAGHRHFSSRLTPYLIDLRNRAVVMERRHPGLEELTKGERRILNLLADAKTSKEIAAELHISPRTVENRLSVIRDKLDLRGHHHLLKFAIEHKTESLM
jgi:DNA-binding NarL/FixJ family response regulator